jgi:murein DD-endopeptidase MepM/ murein hydrolase activator NlpD
MTDVDYMRPCKTKEINDNYAQHVARGSFSPGMDYNCGVGEAIYATANGVVASATTNLHSSAGMAILIQHRDGNLSHYFHLSHVMVNNGQRVKKGDLIAKSGNTGTATTGPHLHFAIKDRSGHFIDPEKLLAKEAVEAKKEKAKAKTIVSDVATPLVESPETIAG